MVDKDDWRIDLMARTVLGITKKYFEDPEHQKEFEEWKKAREAKKEAESA